jgi:hypothetical protein
MKRHEFTKNTRYLYLALAEAAYDCPEHHRVVSHLLESLSGGNMEGIRQGFRDGFIPMMAPDLMPFLDELPKEDEIEIRINHDGKTIGIVINSEITW